MKRSALFPVALAASAFAVSGLTGATDAIGLTVALDRAAPVYAVGDGLVVTIATRRDASLRVWLRDPSGRLDALYPATPDGTPLSVHAGISLRLPRTGALRVTPPAGRYELLVTAVAEAGGSRSLTDAGSRLAGRGTREQTTLAFTVEAIR